MRKNTTTKQSPGPDHNSGLHPPVRDIRDLISYRIARFAAANDRLGQLLFSQPFDIRMNQWRVLALIRALEPVGVRDIADELQMDKGQLSRIGKTLIERGLIRADKGQGDLRTVNWRTTRSGKALYRRVFEFACKRNQSFMSKLTNEEVQTLLGVLNKMGAIVEESLLSETESQ